MPLKLAQYGVGHAHAAAKVAVMQAHPEVELAGVSESVRRLSREQNIPGRGICI